LAADNNNANDTMADNNNANDMTAKNATGTMVKKANDAKNNATETAKMATTAKAMAMT